MAKRLSPALVMTLAGAVFMVGGLVLLVAQLVSPETTTSLFFITPSPIEPTQGFLLETPLAPPPLSRDEIVIMPVMDVAGLPEPDDDYEILPTSEQPTQTPLPSATPSQTPTATHTPIPKQSETPTQTLPPQSVSSRPTATATLTAIPFVTPTPTALPEGFEPARIIIPSIELVAPIQPVWLQRVNLNGQLVSQWRVPEGRTVGWHESSAALGEIGNTVLNGHHNQHGKVFAELVHVQVGDVLRLEALDNFGRDYTVVQSMLLAEDGQDLQTRIENARWLLPSNDERITLVTCWPPLGRTHRLVVVALPSEQVEN